MSEDAAPAAVAAGRGAAQPSRIAVVGLGYVGLPLAVALARHYDVVGYDIAEARIAELVEGRDRTGEVPPERLTESTLRYTADPVALAGADLFIVAVPTPVDDEKRPDLDALLAASRTVGAHLARGALVVYESTVWPGVTEEVCRPVLECASGLVAGVDFHLGYSPERANPGDAVHSLERITKVVAAQSPGAVETLAAVYGAVTGGNLFIARDIRTAEAAKVIENAQRDINIAFVNEIAQIFCKLGLSTHDVLAAARTKWNFLDFAPGLVGGHCIGVDPYYLAHRAVEIGHNPEVVLAGRRMNDSMGFFVAGEVARRLERDSGPVLVLGLTFKENVPDLRNTRVADMVSSLVEQGFAVDLHDPLADRAEARALFGIEPLPTLEGGGYACVLGAVAHDSYRAFSTETFASLLRPGGLIADIKNMWGGMALPAGVRRWTL